jgi:pimeloyl-ACP methyl ester carboxylesterase
VDEQPLTATLELHLAWDADSVTIAGEPVPLESEPSAALALTFTGMPIMELEIFGFLGRLSGLLAERPPLVSTTPYRPGLVPVVFVHGTASSPVRWAELYNRLHADPEIRSRYQFWFFQYDSNQPIAVSSLRLREALAAAVSHLDPAGEDAALRQMVLIGHSQGGLLVKMQSIHSGDRIWNAVSRKPLDELRLTDSNRELLRRGLFVEPLPQVARVIFVATPHRGSFLAARQVVRNLLRRFTSLPSQFSSLSVDLARNPGATKSAFVPTAVDNMSPGNPFIQGLQSVPVAPSIPAHSIIAVKGSGPVEEGNDGVVEYVSAHIDEAVSELVVPSPHSCQANPHTMEEVRRILRLHTAEATAELPPAAR